MIISGYRGLIQTGLLALCLVLAGSATAWAMLLNDKNMFGLKQTGRVQGDKSIPCRVVSPDKLKALGLADPVVINRFQLWAVADWTAVLLCGSVAGFLLAGRTVLLDPLALCAIALTGTVMSVAWYLTFFPPAAYLRYVGRGSGEGLGSRPG